MKKLIIPFLFSFLMIHLPAQESMGLIPLPNSMELHHGQFQFNSKTEWIVESEDQRIAAEFLASRFNTVNNRDYKVKTGKKAKKNSLFFTTDLSLGEEEYTLTVTPNNIIIKSSSGKGAFFAVQTLRQLLPPAIDSNQWISRENWSVPSLEIRDKPRFGYRGFMLDVARYFMPKEDVMHLIDLLAYHKINTFHWHLTDDNGWRIEIKKYPKLTDISAWRVDGHNIFPLRANPEPGEPATSGGYYTQEDIKEIVRYAQERYIEIIPEIEMPAHSNAALAAYPELACPTNNGNHISVLPGIGGKNASTIYCAGNDSVFVFLEDILSEVMELFPTNYIHIGGDEADKYHWERCPKCQARMKEENIPNEEELQSYFIKRINQFLIANGKKLMGWDELVDSEIPQDATIFGWRGMGHGGEKAGNQGFDYIKSPAQRYYFIRYQGPQWFEPFTYFGNITLKDVYDYDPLPEDTPDKLKKHMLGVEACLWTEFISSTSEAQYKIFPRLSAFAEAAWTLPGNKSWEGYTKRLDNIIAAYDYMNTTYAKSMYNIEHCVKPLNGKLEVELSNIRPDIEIRYTSDGSEPKANSPLYKEKIIAEPGTSIRSAGFTGENRMGEILPLQLLEHQASGKKVISDNSTAYVLTNGVRGSEKMTDGEWLDFYDSNGEFTIDLGRASHCSSILLGMLNNAGMGIHLPEKVVIESSTDGINFSPLFEKSYSEPERFQNGFFKTTEEFNTGAFYARYLKFKLTNPGTVPSKMIREGGKTRMVFDEVMVY